MSEMKVPFVGQRSQGYREVKYREVLVGYFPILGWLPFYSREFVIKDLACSLTLAVVLIGESLAHAALSQVNVIHGPYSCMLPPIIYSIFGTCIQGSIGTGGLLALLTGNAVIHLGDIEERDHAAGVLCLLIGILMALMAVCQMSFLVRFLSRPALSGFITGSAVLIIKAMLPPMLGPPDVVAEQGLLAFVHDPALLGECNSVTVALSFISFCFLFFSKVLLPKPVKDLKALIVLGCSGSFCFFFGERYGVELAGSIPSGLPSFRSPITVLDDLRLVKEMLPEASLIALVCFVSSFACAKKCGVLAGYQVIAFNELLALGLANFGSALTSGLPVQIGLSRTALAVDIGVNTPLGANTFTAFAVIAFMQMFSKALAFVPRCVLNAIICNAACGLMEFRNAYKLRSYGLSIRKWKDWVIWNVAFVGTLILGSFKGILFAVAISLAMAIRELVNPRLDILGKSANPEKTVGARWENIKKVPDAKQVPGVLVLRLDGPLFYANSERFQDDVTALEREAASKGQPVGAIVLSAASMPFADSTAMEVLEAMATSFKVRNVQFYISGAYGRAKEFIDHALGKHLGNADIVKSGKSDTQLSIDGCVEVALRKMRGEMPKLASMPRLASNPSNRRIASSNDLPVLNDAV